MDLTKAHEQDESARYLFHEGTSYRSYDYFGCHPTENGHIFRVWAPNAAAVSVTGSFCGWDTGRWPMQKVDDSIWQVVVPELSEFTLYKFAVVTSDGRSVLRADPYAVHAETWPGTASRVFDIGSYSWGDARWMDKRAAADMLCRPMNIYELHAGSWKKYPDGSPFNYRKLAEELVPYLKEMGYTHVEMMPLGEYPADGSWGYQSTGYFAPTSRYGTPRDLMAFVDACHQADIGVLLDWVPARFAKDEHGLRSFDGGPCYEYADLCKGELPDGEAMVFDYGRTEVISFLLSSADNWLRNYHFDGLRMDAVASMLYLDYGREDGKWCPNIYGGNRNLEAVAFLQKLNTHIREHFPGAVTIAEESTAFPKVTAPVEDGGLGFTFKWNLGWLGDTLQYMRTDPFFRKGVHNNLTFGINYAFSENYILPLPHGEVSRQKSSLISRMPGEYNLKFANLRVYAAYMFAHPGKKLTFMGNEFAQFAEWGEDKVLDWMLLDYEMHRRYRSFCKDLGDLYRKTSALWELDRSSDGFEWLIGDDEQQNVVAFLRRDKAGNEIIAVCNFSSVVRENYCIGIPRRGKYTEIFTSDDPHYGGSGLRNGEIYAKLRPLHGREYCLSLTLPAFSAIYLYKKGSRPKAPQGE